MGIERQLRLRQSCRVRAILDRMLSCEELEWKQMLSGLSTLVRDDYYAIAAGSALVVGREPEVSLGANQFRWDTAVGGNGHVYERVEVPMGWHRARDEAARKTLGGVNGHLVTITSAAELDFLRSHFGETRSWIGAYRDRDTIPSSNPNHGWQWVTGETWGYTNWRVNQPDNGNEFVAEVEAEFFWSDLAPIHDLGSFYVEYPIESSSAAQTLVPRGSTWKYWDNAESPGVSWMSAGYNEASWSVGPAELGYGENDEQTAVQYGANPNSKPITTYFRHHFTVNNPNVIDDLSLYLQRDDGVAVYLNGRRLVVDGLPEVFSDQTLAQEASDDGQDFIRFDISAYPLVAGDNILAVEVHQASADSDDLSFDAMLIANRFRNVSPLANDRDPEGDSRSAAIVSGPLHGTIDFSPTGAFTYVAIPAFRGVDQLTYRVHDGTSNSALATIRISVVAPQAEFEAVTDSYQTDENSTLVVPTTSGVLTNDLGVNGASLHAVLVTPPTQGVLIFRSDGSFQYQPQQGVRGADWFEYQLIDDNSASNTVRVSIAVGIPNLVPQSTADRYIAYAGQSLEVQTVEPTPVASSPYRFVWDTAIGGNGHAYELVPFVGDWQNAKLAASQRRIGETEGHLATVTSLAEHQFLASRLGIPNSYAYLGGYKDISAENAHLRPGGWRWITGEPFNYTNWGGGAFGADGERYLETFGPWDYGWNDVPYDMIREWYVVEYPLNDPVRRTVLIPSGAVWKYDDDGHDLGTAWSFAGYNDQSWSSGQAEFGYGDGDERTRIDFGGDESHKYITTYFRRTFTANNVGNIKNLQLNIRRDDALIVYINGVEVIRNGLVTDSHYRSVAINDSDDEKEFFLFAVDPAVLVEGENSIAVEVHQAPNGDDISFDLRMDAIYSQQSGLLSNDFDPEATTLSAVLVTPPSHGTVTLSPTGFFSYTPDSGFVGFDAFTYRATDGTYSSPDTPVALEVRPFNHPPTALPDSFRMSADRVLQIGILGGLLANDSDRDNDQLRLKVVALPSDGTLSWTDQGEFTYTPNPGFHGTDSFSYRVNDGHHNSPLAAVTIHVDQTPQVPSARNDTYHAVEDVELRIESPPTVSFLTATIAGGAPRSLVYDAVGGMLYVTVPTNNVVVPVDPFSGEAGVPINVPGRPDEIVVTDDGQYLYVGTDGSNSVTRIRLATRTIDLVIPLGNSPAVDLHTIPGQPESVAVARNYFEPIRVFDNNVFRPKKYNGANHVEVSEDGRTLFGFTSSISSYEVTENNLSASGTYFVSHRENVVGSGGFVWSDGLLIFDAGQVMTGERLQLKGTITRTGSASAVALPGRNRVAYISDAADTIQISDLITHQRVTNIRVPGQPMAKRGIAFGVDGIAFVAEGTSTIHLVRSVSIAGALRSDILANDSDSEADPISAILVQGPEHGVLDLRADGTFSYQPATNFSGIDRFTYRAVDQRNLSNLATVTLVVHAVNDPPQTTADKYLLPRRDQSLTVDRGRGLLVNDHDAENDPLSVSLASLPAKGTVVLQPDGSFTYTPGPNFQLADTFTYRVRDGKTESQVESVTIELDVPRIDVGEIVLRANTAGQQVPIYVRSGQRVAGVNLYVQVGDGGPELSQFGLPAGMDGPAITEVDLKTHTIFSATSAVQVNQPGIPQVATATVALDADDETVLADGLLVTLTVDTTGFFVGDWDLKLTDVLPFEQLSGPFATDFAGVPAIVRSGRITIREAQMTAQHLVYRNSPLGPMVVAPDKRPLLPGSTATFANYSSYSRGINGILIEVEGFLRDPVVSDFQFQVGRSSNVGTWSVGPVPSQVVVTDDSITGRQRVLIEWPDGAIFNQWLEVKLLPSVQSGVVNASQFYFGSAPGDTGDSVTNALVNATDIVATRDNKRGPFNPVTAESRYDFNRDGLVNATDVVFAREHITSPFTALPLITPSAAQAPLPRREPRAALSEQQVWVSAGTNRVEIPELPTVAKCVDVVWAQADLTREERRVDLRDKTRLQISRRFRMAWESSSAQRVSSDILNHDSDIYMTLTCHRGL